VDAVAEQALRSGARTHVLHLSSAESLPSSGPRERTAPISPSRPVRTTWSSRPRRCPTARPSSSAARRSATRATGTSCGPRSPPATSTSSSPTTRPAPRAQAGLGGDFGAAWGGIASIQVSLPPVWSAAASPRARPHRRGRWMAHGPADRVGLGPQGRIEVGADADLVALAPDEEFVVDVAALAHKNPVSGLRGRRLSGVVRAPGARGAVAPTDHPMAAPVRGRCDDAPAPTTPPRPAAAADPAHHRPVASTRPTVVIPRAA
jgi:allantoinase